MSQVLSESTFPSGQRLQLVQGDLTTEPVDAIVNAANHHLQHGGGLAGAIVKRGGEAIQAESDTWVSEHGLVTNAEPAYTRAGKLPCRYVIHAVGPVWGEGDEDRKLEEAVTGSLRLAEQLKLSSVALPAISTGIFGFPKERAAGVILSAVAAYFAQNPEAKLSLVRITLFDRPTLDIFLRIWEKFSTRPDPHISENSC